MHLVDLWQEDRTSIAITFQWMESKSELTNNWEDSMSLYQSKTISDQIWSKNAPIVGLKFFFDSWYHLNLLNIVVYHDMQNEKRLTTNNGENEFGDKNDLETSLNWALIWPENFFQPQNHNCLLDIMTASCMQNQRNLMIQTWIIDQKPQIWAQFSQIWAK